MTSRGKWKKMGDKFVALLASGDTLAASLICKQALDIAYDIFPTVDKDLADNLNYLAALYTSLGKWSEAEPLYKEAIHIYKELYGDHPNDHLSDSLNNLAELYRLQGKLDEAEPLYEKCGGIKFHGATA